ncbi:MAG: hypothetical protein ABI348_06195 [Nitrososphaera sp.]
MKPGYRKVVCAQCEVIVGYVAIQPHTSTIVKAYCEDCYQQLR